MKTSLCPFFSPFWWLWQISYRVQRLRSACRPRGVRIIALDLGEISQKNDEVCLLALIIAMQRTGGALGGACSVCLALPGGYVGQGAVELSHQLLLIGFCKRAAKKSLDPLGKKPLPALLF